MKLFTTLLSYSMILSLAIFSQMYAEKPTQNGLFLDLNANVGLELEDGNRVKAWHNQIKGNQADIFIKRDKGRKVTGSGRPTLKTNLEHIGGGNTLVFEEQELINMNEDAFDHMCTGHGYTWLSVMCVYQQNIGKKDVNSFFGNLKNGAPYDGFWGNLMDDNRLWMGTRNGFDKRPVLWHKKLNPLVVTPTSLKENKYYLVIGRMGAGQGKVSLELYLNSPNPIDQKQVPINIKSNPSKMAIGQERDATNHPGKESFHGEIARFLIYERPLSDSELKDMVKLLKETYHIK